MVQKYVFFAIVLILAACQGEDFNYPEVPAISLKSFEQLKLNNKDSAVIISLDYTDGDGDIGLEPSDTLSPFEFGGPYFYNLHVYPYEVVDGIKKPIMVSSTDSVDFNDRITTLTPTGKNKAIFGVIRIALRAQPTFSVTPDSMCYRIFIYDRKLHKSNVVETPVRAFVF
ncbi:MAG: hypothetical protein JNM67_10910 [Bacteroidetes bacterium]|nr:hypothetical protein [Bacteroidota bacterium]